MQTNNNILEGWDTWKKETWSTVGVQHSTEFRNYIHRDGKNSSKNVELECSLVPVPGQSSVIIFIFGWSAAGIQSVLFSFHTTPYSLAVKQETPFKITVAQSNTVTRLLMEQQPSPKSVSMNRHRADLTGLRHRISALWHQNGSRPYETYSNVLILSSFVFCL